MIEGKFVASDSRQNCDDCSKPASFVLIFSRVFATRARAHETENVRSYCFVVA